jgi:radical SAM superfamily enzyme YgiQ (UPF0313 family)
MRRVVLVSLDWIRPGDPRTSLGTASIASALRAADLGVEVVSDAVNRDGFDPETLFHRVVRAAQAAGSGALISVGAYVWNEPEVQQLMPLLRRESECVSAVGGPQVSYTARGALERIYPHGDVFVRGHGEDALVALATGTWREGEDGVHLAGSPDVGRRAEVDLAALPSPPLDGTLPIGPFVRWETQRGCQFACTFCQHRESGERLQRRHLHADRLLGEIAAFADQGVRRIAVLDPIFHSDRRRAVGLLRAMRTAGLRAQLSLQCRFELIDDEFLDALEGLDVELEFGLQTVHADEARAVGRPNRIDIVEDVVGRLNARGLAYEVSLIYGLPLQTLDRFRQSVDWCLERRVPRVRAWPLMLLRGTGIEAQRETWGFKESTGCRIPVVVASHTFDESDHEEMSRIAAQLLQFTATLSPHVG